MSKNNEEKIIRIVFRENAETKLSIYDQAACAANRNVYQSS